MRSVVLAALALASLGADAAAQTWSYLDCAASRIVVPADFYLSDDKPLCGDRGNRRRQRRRHLQACDGCRHHRQGQALLHPDSDRGYVRRGSSIALAEAFQVAASPAQHGHVGTRSPWRCRHGHVQGCGESILYRHSQGRTFVLDGLSMGSPGYAAPACGQVASDADIDTFIHEARVQKLAAPGST